MSFAREVATFKLSKPVPLLKSNAKILEKEFGITHIKALDIVAKMEGLSSWSLLAARHEQLTDAITMFPHVFFVCKGGYTQNENYLQSMNLKPENCFKIEWNDFIKGFIAAIQSQSADAFTEQYLSYPILIITNIHRFRNKMATQGEVVRIFEKRKGKTIITSLVSQKEITEASEEDFTRDFRSLIVECSPACFLQYDLVHF
ncbi:MAG: hypothetical protein A2X86_16665 [Bdellovibrionales bacterium GWA2_49_15]|nr:MAG: hypothetical protein A2X86_16665 [Bdellovibrionales bacterium GWA2_49_15]HAZ14627.1 hypothetical protein [Bdellovibrionales bacterium]